MIYHIEAEDPWQQALLAGEYVPESLRSDGFIHCSALEQVADVANRHYRDIHGLVLLCISQKLLDSETLWEPTDGLYYPHIYGPLNPSAVVAAVPFPCDEDGTFQLPANMPEDTDDLPETDI